MSGAASSLPHLETIQRSFGPGHDLSGVRGHVGGPATIAAAEMGAQAYAKGGRVAFAEAPSLHTAAHEAAHVVQQRAGVHLKGGVGEVGDPYELHADAVADAVVRGEDARGLLDEFPGTGGTSAGGAVQQQLQMEAKALRGTYHAAPTITQGTMLDTKGEAVGAPSSGLRPAEWHRMNVAIVASEAAKLRVPVGKVPTAEQLYVCSTAGTPVEQTQGTIDQPNEVSHIVEDCLFIAGKPDAADIRQGGISDCYFLAALFGIIHQDPDKLTSMMSSAGGQVTTEFFRYNREQRAWISQLITNPSTLLTMSNGKLQGISFRVASTPAESLWYVKLESGVLQLFREDRYECAMWAPLLEKNYADFAQNFGKYGDQDLVGGKSGYDVIANGMPQACYHMFYGDSVVAQDITAIAFNPHGDDGILAQNTPALKQLIKLYEAMQPRASKGRLLHFVQARIDELSASRRCKALVEGILSDLGPASTNLDDGAGFAPGEREFAEALRPLLTAVTQLIATKSEANLTEVERLARSVQNPSAYPILWSNGARPRYIALRENLGLLTDIGPGRRAERRTLTPLHAYNVHSVAFIDHHGRPLALTHENLATSTPHIDAARSTVVLESPWGESEWDERGEGPLDGADDGRFTLTLGQFLRNIDTLRWATVARRGD